MLHLVPGETGGSELYARRLVPALLDARQDLRLIVLAGEAALPSLTVEEWAGEVELVGLPFDPRHRARRVLAEQTLLPRAARKRGVDLLHNLFTTAPGAPLVPQVTTILDVIYKRFPETHAGLLGRGLAALTWTAARRSRRILTISEAAKADIVRFLGVPADNVDVTYPGPALPQTAPADARAELGLGPVPIVLTVSAKRPHKNLERLFEAFAQVRAEPAPILVVPGYETFHEDELRKRADEIGVADRIRFAGWVADDVLEGLYREAACLVFPSLAEGFGLPVLDALVRGTPVACSNASSLPEVAGDAALYFEPTDTDAIAAAIERLLADEALRERLRAAGLSQAAKFSWARTAEGTIESYDRALATR
ncbi:MAG: glycosyltransferase family 4 protein [Actinobacteria bacterium]|nr:MAG: glycosyltransferase family 4 protein [Actinomycetota bacterium]